MLSSEPDWKSEVKPVINGFVRVFRVVRGGWFFRNIARTHLSCTGLLHPISSSQVIPSGWGKIKSYNPYRKGRY